MKSTKDIIFEKAVQLFAAKGVHGSSMRELARQVGIKESSIYNHFRGKDAILDAVLDYYIQGFHCALPSKKDMDETASQYDDPVELWLRGTMDFIRRLPPLMDQVTLVLLNEMFLNQKCRTFILETMFRAQKEATVMLLSDLRTRGMIRECDIEMTAHQYVYLIHGLSMENRLQLLESETQVEVGERLASHMRFFIQNLK